MVMKILFKVALVIANVPNFTKEPLKAMPAPVRAPKAAPMNPCKKASIKKSLKINLSKAPKHFMVPISLNLSATAINWVFTMPTTQTSKDKNRIQRSFGVVLYCSPAAGISYPSCESVCMAILFSEKTIAEIIWELVLI